MPKINKIHSNPYNIKPKNEQEIKNLIKTHIFIYLIDIFNK